MANMYTATPFAPEVQRQLDSPDPQPALAQVARGCPVHRGPDGSLSVVRLEDVVALCRNPEVPGPGANGPTMGGKRPLPPLDLDGPEHTRFRRLLDPLLTPKALARWEAPLVKLTDELIDAFITRGEADLVEVYCQPLPSIFFARMMGLPERDLPEFLDFKDKILGHFPEAQAKTLTYPQRLQITRAASEKCYTFLGALLDAREASGPTGEGDLIDSLLGAESEGRKLTREELLDLCYLLVIGGLDTTASALACLLARLARTPALRARLLAEPALWGTAVEELLRYESPVQRGMRTARADLAVGGETIPAGTQFFVSWAAANLDERALADALTLDLARKPNPHVAFGSGFHKCLGAHLARLELRVALERLHARLPDYTLVDESQLSFKGQPRVVTGLRLRWSV
jgi:cytochrome P450